MGVLSSEQDVDEQREEQRRQQMHMQNLGSAGAQDSPVDPDYVDRITTSEMDQGTVRILKNMLSRDWVLANFDDAEVHEIRWLARVMMKQLEALHPPEDSIWTGELRKYAADDDRQALEPLDSAQRLVVFETIQGIISRATRSKDGWQQENFNKTINQSETIDRSSDDDGGWL
ncbi:hypothetical protein [Natrinema sp. CGMCC1.2065]|uniref:hypothetical protein n=1 Tax=Natrinema sp. CGMCC1.2065 TaxID=3445767 RepID=UPI003F4A153B